MMNKIDAVVLYVILLLVVSGLLNILSTVL